MSLIEAVILFFSVWMICPLLGWIYLCRYKKTLWGILLGVFCGPLGLTIALAMRSSEIRREDQRRLDEEKTALQEKKIREVSLKLSRECPFCAEKIMIALDVCEHCGNDVVPIIIRV